jgi:hypothetical protein
MIPRIDRKRKYRPGLETLERKQLLSAGLPTYGHPTLAQATVSVSSHSEQATICPCGTGKGIVIITS